MKPPDSPAATPARRVASAGSGGGYGGADRPAASQPAAPSPARLGAAAGSGYGPPQAGGSGRRVRGPAGPRPGRRPRPVLLLVQPVPQVRRVAPAGSGSGYPPPAGYGPAAWSGQASQQAPGAPPWSGAEYAPSRRGRSGLGWKAAVAALAIIGAGGRGGHRRAPAPGSFRLAAGSGVRARVRRRGRRPDRPPATLPPPTLQIIDAINQPATGPLPSGFTMTSQPAAANETRRLQHRRADQLAEVRRAATRRT